MLQVTQGETHWDVTQAASDAPSHSSGVSAAAGAVSPARWEGSPDERAAGASAGAERVSLRRRPSGLPDGTHQQTCPPG